MKEHVLRLLDIKVKGAEGMEIGSDNANSRLYFS